MLEPFYPHIWYAWRPQTRSTYILFAWNVGSRHDPLTQEGLLHFLEHTLFKGTVRRRAPALFDQIERYGGELNAFTTKDKMAIEIRISSSYLTKALQLLWELVHEAAFPEAEVEKERQVILEEIAMYEDIPEESLLDHFEEQIFSAGGLRHPIIGYPQSIENISAQTLRTFYEQNLHKVRWILLLTGDLSTAEVERRLKQTPWPNKEPASAALPFAPEVIAPPTTLRLPRSTQQVHLAIGGVGASPYDRKQSLPLQVLLYALGGGHMTSRLNLILREKYGWCYSVYTFFHAYPERSVWGIYAGLTPAALEKARNFISRELSRWIERPIPPSTLYRIRRAFIGRQTLLSENPAHLLYLHARYLLDRGEPFPEVAWKEELMNLTPSDIQHAAQQVFRDVYERVYLPTPSEG